MRFWEHQDPVDAAASVEHALHQWSAIADTAVSTPGRMERMIEVVAGVLTQPDGRVLVCRRAPDRSAAGQWEFPGGKLEPGESAEEALRRELQEELGVDAVVGGLINRTVTRVDSLDIDLATYRVPWVGPGPTSSTDHDELRWLSPTDLSSLRWATPDLPTVRVLTDGLATA